jgi:hypothetical protein
MKRYLGGYIDVGKTVAISETKWLLDVWMNTLQAASGVGVLAGVNQRYLPWLGVPLVYLHSVFRDVKRDIRHMQEIVRKILLMTYPLYPQQRLHDVPEQRLGADLDLGLGLR